MSDSPSSGNHNSAFGEWIVRYRWLVLFGSLALAMVAGSGGSRLAFNNDYRVLFSEDNPELQAFEKLQRTYTKIDNILFTIAPGGKDVFAPAILDAVEYLTLDAWQLPFVLRVDSITNYQHTVATDDDLIVVDLAEGAVELSSPELSEIATLLKNHHARASRLLTETIAAGQEAGELREDLSAEQLSKTLFTFCAGLLSSSKCLQDATDPAQMVDAALTLVRA